MTKLDFEFSKTTCPRDCYDSCGITVERNDDGSIRRLVGDREHHMARGKLCGKCALAYNGAWRDPDVRLDKPLKRSGKKGDAQFVPITWDDALTEIANRLSTIRNAGRQSSILHTHYTGTCAILGGFFPLRFFNEIGAREVEPDTVCNNAAHASLIYTFGESLEGFDPAAIKDADCVLIWGANPSASAPHVHDTWIGSTSAKTIVIDPFKHRTAQKADLHLQLKPGSDAVLAFGLLHIAQRMGKLDQKIIAEHMIGWDDVAPHVEATTPDVTARETGLTEEQIHACADIYLKGNSLMWLGQGLQRQLMGGNIYRACALLSAVTGNIGRPGSGLLFLNGPNTRGADIDYVAKPELADNPPGSVSHMDLIEVLNDRDQAEVLFTWNNNIAASNPRQADLKTALSRDDLFQVSIELFHTDTTAFADIILPAASFLEYEDLLFPYFENTVSALNKVMDAPGEALSNAEIFRRLAKAMGLSAPELFETDRSVIDEVLANSDADISFDELKLRGTVPVYDTPRIQFEDMIFNTPSGKIEISSQAAVDDGCAHFPTPVVAGQEDTESLKVISPSSDWTLNTSYGNDDRVRARLREQSMLICPADSRRMQVEDGQDVYLVNETGKLRLKAKVSDATLPGVVIVPKGHWPMFESENDGNVNILNPGIKCDMGESSSVHSVEARIELVPS